MAIFTAPQSPWGSSHDGTVFKVTLSGDELTLYNFEGGKDGANPVAGLTDLKGVLYGTTSGGGSSGYGTVFRIAP